MEDCRNFISEVVWLLTNPLLLPLRGPPGININWKALPDFCSRCERIPARLACNLSHPFYDLVIKFHYVRPGSPALSYHQLVSNVFPVFHFKRYLDSGSSITVGTNVAHQTDRFPTLDIDIRLIPWQLAP